MIRLVIGVLLASAGFAQPVGAAPTAPRPVVAQMETPEPPGSSLQSLGGTRPGLALAFQQSCVLLGDGLVRCWGFNVVGQLGDNTINGRNYAGLVLGLGRAVQLDIGAGHSCALLADGTVRCWGNNIFGQLGDGTTTDRLTPVAVSGLRGVVGLASGRDHACALLGDGAVRCWGNNSAGQLGDGTTTSSTTPVAVSGLDDVVQLTAGNSHTCALLVDGTARCWGNNSAGQLGNGSTATRTTPVAVSGLDDAVELTAGGAHTCALLSDGTVRCWGFNGSGQLGDGTTTDRLTPVAVPGLNRVRQLALSDNHSCALLSNGSARCWGFNGIGQLGDGTTTDRLTPVAVAGISRAVALGAGDEHSCALFSNGTVRCWGSNGNGQLGANSPAFNSLSPLTVVGLNDVVQVASGSNYSCALLADGTVRCWGRGLEGQLGNGSTISSATPVTVSGLTGVVQLALNFSHSCALLADGTARCWGSNSFGQLGDGTFTQRTTPVVVSGLANAVQLALGFSHSCALLADGSARCWGSNSFGQLGDGTLTQRTTPVVVSGLNNALQLAVGSSHSCARLSNERMQCWGSNTFGELGNGTTTNSSTPVAVSSLTAVVGVAAGNLHTCAILFGGSVNCWGDNSFGQLGDNSTTNRSTPTPVAGLADARLLAAGGNHSCAVLRDGTLRCWGRGLEGQLGDGSSSNRLTPVAVSGINDALELTTGFNFSCARVRNGTLRCWGANNNGQLGNGTVTIDGIPVPAPVIGLVPPATLQLSKQAPTLARPGTPLTYTLSYTSSQATTLLLTDTLPAGMQFLSASGGGSPSGGTVIWQLGNVLAGSGQLTLVVTPTRTLRSTNVAVLSDAGSTVTATATTDVEPLGLISQEADGQVVIEAERFSALLPGSGSAAAITWTTSISSAASSNQVVQALPNSNVNTGSSLNGPELRYQVRFTTPGTYTVWLRGLGPAPSSSSNDSVHVGLDGVAQTLVGVGLDGFAGSGLNWRNRANGQPVQLAIPTPGVYTINVWMREDGVMLDKLLLALNPALISSGSTVLGPAESSWDDGSQPFLESGGQVVLEAEQRSGVRAGSGAFANVGWAPVVTTTASGNTALFGLPNLGANAGSTISGTALLFRVQFTITGTYNLWLRGSALAPTGANDSVHAGLNGMATTLADAGINGTFGANDFRWNGRVNGTQAQIVVPAPGIHTVFVWLREDGVGVDRLLLSTNPNAIAQGSNVVGPPASGRAP